MEPLLVLIEKGDVILMRHDILHAGAENLTECKNLMLRFFIDIPSWKISVGVDYSIKKCEWQRVPKMSK